MALEPVQALALVDTALEPAQDLAWALAQGVTALEPAQAQALGLQPKVAWLMRSAGSILARLCTRTTTGQDPAMSTTTVALT